MKAPGLLTRARAFALDHGLTLVGLAMSLRSRHYTKLSLAELGQARLRQANQRRIRRRATAIRVAEGVVLCRVLGRYKMYVDAEDHSLAVHLMMDGYWEMWVTQIIASLVRPGMVVADVGANQGYFTLLMADLVGRSGRVLAFEPNPRMTALLRRSLHANGLDHQVELHTAPAGRGGPDRVVLHVPDGMPSGAHVTIAEGPDAVPTLALDDVLGDAPLHVVKIDAEGWELDVWAGMRRILARGLPMIVLMEFVIDRKPGAAAFLEEVVTLGFTLSHIGPGGILHLLRAETILAAPQNQEWMLVLRRGE